MDKNYIQLLQERGLVDNRTIKLLDVLKEALTCGLYPRIDITVGFLFLSGLKEIKDELKQFFENGGEMRIVLGNVMQEKTYEQLVYAYNSIERVKKIQSKSMFSNEDRINPNAEAYSRQLGQTSHTKENQEMAMLLKSWLESGQLKLRIYTQEYMHAKTYLFHAERGVSFGLVGSSNLSLSGLMANTELNAPVAMGHYNTLKNWFEEIWNQAEDFNPALIEVIRKSWADPEYLPPPYEVLIRGLYELFRDVVDADIKGMYITTLFSKLYEFQIDAAKRAIAIAERLGGVLISDVVGLGKTYIACATAHDLSLRSMYSGKPYRVAVISPRQLVKYWKSMLAAFNIEGEVFSAGLLSIDEERSENKRVMMEYVRDKAGVVIVDEAHNYANPETESYKTLKKILVGKHVLLLTATPYRRNYGDIINLIQLFVHTPTPPFQVPAKSWTELAELIQQGKIPPSYVLREVMVRRTRYDIIKLYGGERNCINFGDKTLCFPERRLKTLTYSISDVYDLRLLPDVVSKLTRGKRRIEDVYELLIEGIKNMTYARFNLYKYVRPEYKKVRPYSELSQSGNLKGITKMLFLKRLESSWYAFYKTVERSLIISKNFVKFLRRGVVPAGEDYEDILLNLQEGTPKELTYPEVDAEIARIGIKYDADKFNVDALLRDVNRDIEILEAMYELVEPLKETFEENPLEDNKLSALAGLIEDLMQNTGQKILIFSEYSETVEWIYRALERIGLTNNWSIAAITSKTKNINEFVKRFAPKANNYATDDPIDILIATDVLSEGLNLQDANVVVNYDLHWTPVKLIQRIGRVDRIGSEHETVYIYNFFPETLLDRKLGLVEKIKTRVKEFGSALGADGKILEETEEWNPSAIEAIYGGDDNFLNKLEEETSLAIADGAESVLRKFMEEWPEKFDEIKKQYSMRSCCHWNGEYPLAFFVCTNGVKTNYYILRRDGETWELNLERNIEKLLKDTELTIETRPSRFHGELYYSAAEKAMQVFKQMIEDTESGIELAGKKKGKKLSRKNLDRLYKILSSTTTEERSELSKIFDMAKWAVKNVKSFDSDFKKIKTKSDSEFIDVVKKLLLQYNIPEMMAMSKERLEESGRKAFEPHIVAGLIFVPK
ncbi:helicase-related protein [Geoglobus acetivorans]|uniref:Phospholipase D-like domain-containing protein n=1 Tax=Geoglobus acetivorans TaxID=565033 RepID=A0ABZ3H308_GEOAI|nr:DEAD/DEAH box helicase family protein [Geoglobus acetivorans]